MAVTGIDISEYQGNWEPAKSIAQGAQFVMIRGGQGNKYQDLRYSANVLKAKAANLPWGVYHVAQPGGDWEKQAAFALALADDAPLGLWLDIELDGSLSNDALGNWLSKYVTVVDAHAVAGIYTRAEWWDRKIPRCDWAKLHDLWVAHYNVPSPALPKDWAAINNPKTWMFWQYSADGNGKGPSYGVQSEAIDINRFNGDLATFMETFDLDDVPEVEPPAEPPPAVIPDKIRIAHLATGNMLNMRVTIAGTICGRTWNGCTFDVESSAPDSQGRPWYQIGKSIWIASWYTEAA